MLNIHQKIAKRCSIDVVSIIKNKRLIFTYN